MAVPYFDLKRQYVSIQDRAETAVLETMRSCGYIEGQAVRDLEEALCSYLRSRFVITCGNGTDALKIALKSLGVSEGDEVITTPFTFFATAESIVNVGAIPVFVDIDERTLNIDPTKIEEAITDKTKAILPVHIFGMPADMDHVNEIADAYNLAVVEDACQAIGSTYKGRMAGTLGDLGCFSFYPTKNLGGFGDGGMIATDDEELANACRAFKAHAPGKIGARAARFLGAGDDKAEDLSNQQATDLYDPQKYFNYLIADNSRLDSIQAAVLGVKLPLLDSYNESRRRIACRYSHEFADLPIRLPTIEDGDDTRSCCHQYAILSDDKFGLIAHLEEKGIGASAFYPVPMHLQKAFASLGYESGLLPVAESVCARSVCLPLFPELTDDEQTIVIEAVRGFFA